MKTVLDWLPQNHEALYDQGMQTWTYLNTGGNRERMGLAPGTLQGTWLTEKFWSKFNAFTMAFDSWKNSAERTPVKTTLLHDTDKAFKETYRQLYIGFLKNSPFVTNEDLVNMGLPKRPTGRSTSVPAPTSYVETTVTPIGPAVIDIHFQDKGSEHKAKPAGMRGAEIMWAILDTPPENWEELTRSSFNTHTPLRMSFENDRRGKTLYFAARWENTHGDKGPWSEIQSAIIP